MKSYLVTFDFYFTDPLMEPYPHQFATALFSFLYHLASYDAGGEALVSCGMMEALLKVHILISNIVLFKQFLRHTYTWPCYFVLCRSTFVPFPSPPLACTHTH